MKSSSYLNVILALAVANVPGVQSAKPIHQLVFTAGQIAEDLKLILGNLWLQIDQTGDPSHAQTITSAYTVCVAATQAEIAACNANCRKEANGDSNLLKECVNGCDASQDCHQQCGTHSTANFVKFGGAMKLLLTKNCTVPTDSCPNCALYSTTPLVDDYDATMLVPNPIVSGLGIGIGAISCTLTRFTINLNISGNPDYDQLVTTDLSPSQGLHINIKASADSPTLKCTGAIGIDATLHNSNFDFFFNPSVTNHKAAWAASATFHTDVSDALEGVYDLDSTVEGKVNDLLSAFLGNPNNTASISQGLTDWMVNQISVQNEEDVDDIVSIVTTAASITVSYTPKCVDGVCTCSTSCNGAHYCAPNYWANAGPGLTCTTGQVCLATGDCCTPSCLPNGCGSDGCGRSCGTCAVGTVCSGKSCVACTEGACNHICSKTACETWCGTCKPGWVCGDGGCQDSRVVPRRALNTMGEYPQELVGI